MGFHQNVLFKVNIFSAKLISFRRRPYDFIGMLVNLILLTYIDTRYDIVYKSLSNILDIFSFLIRYDKIVILHTKYVTNQLYR